MSPRANAVQPTPLRSLLAKLVMGAGVVVALADSPPRTWIAEEEWSKRVALDELTERRFLVTIELGGALYADTRSGDVTIRAVADRAASDLTLTGWPLTPPEEPVEPADPGVAGFPEDTFADAGASDAASDAGARPGGEESSRPGPGAADQAGIGFDLACTERDRLVPEEPRPEACVEQFELTLARESERRLSAELRVYVRLIGETQRQPPGTLQIHVQELGR